jgi:hypothetical protein
MDLVVLPLAPYLVWAIAYYIKVRIVLLVQTLLHHIFSF